MEDDARRITETTGKTEKQKTSIKLIFLVLSGLAQTVQFTAIDLLPAFFPSEATKKGSTSTEYGMVMGVCFLAMGVGCILWSFMVTKFSAKRQLFCSIFAVGGLSIAFGFVKKLPDGATFLAVALILRILVGGASAVSQVISYAMIPIIFPGNEAKVFAVMEMSVGLGYTIGPGIGGVLFDAGGFLLPFVVCSVPLFLFAILYLWLETPEVAAPTERVSILKIANSPSVVICCLVIFSTEVDFGFLTATLEPCLEKFHLTHTVIGFVILGSGGAYAVSSPIFGYLCDKGVSAELGSVLGTVITSFVFLFLGPVPWLPFEPQLWLIIVCVIFCGLGVAAKMICAFKILLLGVLSRGYPDNLVTYAAVSSIFAAFAAWGAFAGPAAGGFFLGLVGMSAATEIMFFFEVFLIILQVSYLVALRMMHSRDVAISANEPKTKEVLRSGSVWTTF